MEKVGGLSHLSFPARQARAGVILQEQPLSVQDLVQPGRLVSNPTLALSSPDTSAGGEGSCDVLGTNLTD